MIREWDKLINRIQLEVSQRIGGHSNNLAKDKVTAIKLIMLVDCEGQPIVWSVESTNVEPGSKAKALLELL